MDEFDQLLSVTPDALEQYIVLPGLGGEIILYEGEFWLKTGDSETLLRGKIGYTFCEKIELLFEGESASDASLSAWVGNYVDLVSQDHAWTGEAIVLRYSQGQLRGSVDRIKKIDQPSCKRWRWCYLNVPKVFGDSVRRGRKISRDRLLFQASDYQIILENKEDYFEQKSHREISHYCEIRRMDGSLLSFDEANAEIILFSRFVSFFSGNHHSPFFIEGLDECVVKSEINAVGHERGLVGVSTWKPDFKDQDLVPLWRLFRARYKESSDTADVLNTVLHWYLEANQNSGMLEGAFLLGFTGLELLSDEIVGKELGNKERVADFFQRLNIAVDVEPEVISSMRNTLMHYKKQKRAIYANTSFDDKWKRLEVLLLVLELSLLYWLGYEGHYCNRLIYTWRGSGVKKVPWIVSSDDNTKIR